MADRLIKSETLEDIANALRERTEKTDKIPITKFAEEIRTLETVDEYDGSVTVDDGATVTFDEDYAEGHSDGFNEGHDEGYTEGLSVGHNNGYTEGHTAGYEQGRQDEHAEFMGVYQNYGSRTQYNYAFAGLGWTDETYRILYPFGKPTHVIGMFYGSQITDVKYPIDLTNLTSSTNNFIASSAIKKITIISSENTSYTASSTFTYCSNLEELTVQGVIGRNGFDVQMSPKLSKASITSIINALSTTTSGLTVTLSQTAVNNAFTTDEWNTLIATKSNWTISLV